MESGENGNIVRGGEEDKVKQDNTPAEDVVFVDVKQEFELMVEEKPMQKGSCEMVMKKLKVIDSRSPRQQGSSRTCPDCSQVFDWGSQKWDRREYIDHVKLCGLDGSSQENGKKLKRAQNAEKTFKCNHCDKKFGSEYLVVNHMRSKHQPEPQKYVIEEGSGMGFNKYGLKYHKVTVDKKVLGSMPQKNQKSKNVPAKTFKCLECGKVYLNILKLNKHIYTHHEKLKISCPEDNCNKQFIYRSSMGRHKKDHQLK